MATILSKTLVRESTELVDERNIMVSLSDDQSIKMKLKGMKSGEVSVGIKDLYKQLGNINDEEENSSPKNVVKNKKEEKEVMINLYDLRSMFHVTPMDTKTLIIFDKVILEILENKKR